MSTDPSHPARLAEENWATGPLARCLSEIPLRYAAAALVADLSGKSPVLYNGTATLIQLGSNKLAITCAHVLEKYRDLWRSERKSIFQIGSTKFEPISQLISEDLEADLAVIRLSGEQADALENEGKRIFLPVSWPPAQIREGDWVALGGYPGTMREQKAWNELDFTTYSIGATPVTSVSETNIGCRFERQRWVYGHRIDGVADPEDLGGLSGGPAFIVRQLHWELAGIMYEFSPTFDIMFLRPAHTIQEDGSIRPLP